MDSLAEQVMVKILAQEMAMPPDSVWIRDQNRLIPNDDRLYIIVGMANSTPISATVETISSEQGMTEIQKVVGRDEIQIDIMSRGNEALLRRYEILTALRSIYSQQMQEKNNFRIFRLPVNFVNTSEAEGGSRLNRFSVTIPCHVWYKKEKVLSTPNGDYYNDFTQRVDDDHSIETNEGIIEFEIKEGDEPDTAV